MKKTVDGCPSLPGHRRHGGRRRTQPVRSRERPPTAAAAWCLAGAYRSAISTPASRRRPWPAHRRLLSGHPAATWAAIAWTIEADGFASRVVEPIQVSVSEVVRSERGGGALERQRDRHRVRRDATGRYLDQCPRPRRHRPRARGPAAQRPQLHAARTAADRRGAADGRRGHRGRQRCARGRPTR